MPCVTNTVLNVKISSRTTVRCLHIHPLVLFGVCVYALVDCALGLPESVRCPTHRVPGIDFTHD